MIRIYIRVSSAKQADSKAGMKAQEDACVLYCQNQGFTEYKLNKALETIEKVFERRAKKLEQNEKLMLEHIFNSTQEQRNY